MSTFTRALRHAGILLLAVGSTSLSGTAFGGDGPGETGDDVGIEPTQEARALAREVIAKANALYYRLFAPGSPGFSAVYAVACDGQPAGRIRLRAVPEAARPEVTYEGGLDEGERTLVVNHAQALLGPLCGPFLATEEEYGHPIYARLRDQQYLLDLSGRGRIPGVRASTLYLASDLSKAREVGELTDGTSLDVVRKGGVGGEKRYLTSLSWVRRRPESVAESIDYSWAWSRTKGTMFVKRFTAKQVQGAETREWELILEQATFGAAGADGTAPPPAPDPERTPARTQPPAMRKVVSEQARFVLYAPKDWTVEEGATRQYWWVVVADPASGSRAVSCHGISPSGNDVKALAGQFLAALRGSGVELSIAEARSSAPDGRLYVRGSLTGGGTPAREYRAWFSVRNGSFTYFRVDVPEGQYEQRKQLLLSLLTNVGAVKGTFGSVAAGPLPTQLATLPQNAASFQLPEGWRVTPLGSIYFLAQDPQATCSFLLTVAEALTPRMGVRPPGVPVSPVRTAHDAFTFFGEQSRLISNVRMLSISAKPELAAWFATGYTAGPVTAEEFVYTFDDAQGRRCKGYTLGLVLGSRLDINWKLLHLTATAPVDEFDLLAATFVKMGASYRVDDAYAARYVAEGMARVREMVRQTSEIVSRNAAEIRSMMTAAYEERMASGDYIDFLRTGYIRGEATWVSQAEGGTLYRSDRWGLENETSGERWDGQPFNYYNFTGGGGYGGLTEINRRDLYERYVRGGR